MKIPAIKTVKSTICVWVLCVPFYGTANVKQGTIEVLDLDEITITEVGGNNKQVVGTSEKKLGENTTKRVIAKKSALSDADKRKFASQANKLVSDAYFMLQKANAYVFYEDLKQKLSTAKAVIIFPSLLKASFFFGVGGGNGVLLVRNDNNNWSYPSFYGSTKAGFGLQFGASANSIITVIQSQRALENLLQRQFKVEAGLDAAVGEVGDGQAFSLSTSIHTYSMNKGATIGVSFDGQSLTQKPELNNAFYDAAAANTQTIIYDRMFSNDAADKLRQILNDL